MTNRAKLSASLLVALAGIGVIAWVYSLRENPITSPQKNEVPISVETGAQRVADMSAARMSDAGKDKGDVASRSGGGGMASPALPSYGQLKPIAPDASPQVKSSVEAALTKTHPERLSCAIMPEAFDAKKFQTDSVWREAYLANPEPGRCYQSAQPGKDVHRIALACPAYIPTLQGQPVTLSVRATPGMPVTYTSFDGAMFVDTKLTTQTVVADADGLATVQLLATPGVISNCRVRASCPVDSGAAIITVNAKLPTYTPSVAKN